ncbi:MAG TPA: hypothetical protein VEW69_02815 [Alphaproteobacteria bacterium]|nr:hypothetical protein [Alphaproteobacteria bacterium]
MHKSLKGIILSAVGLCLGAVAIAQAPEQMGPPKILVISREVVKMGQSAAHEKWEAGWPAAFGKANWPVHYLAASSLTGESRVLFISGYESEAAWEKDNWAIRANTGLNAQLGALAAKDADFLKETTTSVFAFMPELSYNPGVQIATMRYFRVVSIQVKPGHGDHFAESRKIARAAHEKAGLQDHYAVYQRVNGGSVGLYLIFIPMKSLAEDDQFPTVHGAAYKSAMGDDGQKKMTEFEMQGEEGVESQIFEFSPKMSYPAKEWVDADHDFWAPKPAAAKPAAAKKPAQK